MPNGKKAVDVERVRRTARTLELLAHDWARSGGPDLIDESLYWLVDRAASLIKERLKVIEDG